jgi:hypothetical protein
MSIDHLRKDPSRPARVALAVALALTGLVLGASAQQTAPDPATHAESAPAASSDALEPDAVVDGEAADASPVAGSDEGAATEDFVGDADAQSAEVEGVVETTRKARSLASILQSRRALGAQLIALQAELESDAARGREQEIRAEIREVSDKLATLSHSFSELAAEIDPEAFSQRDQPADINLTGEIRELLGPLVNELKRATSRPREIDRLRTRIGQTHEDLELIATGLGNVAVLEASVQDPDLRAALEQERRDWIALNLELATRYEIDRQKLTQMMSEQTSFSEAMGNVFEIFFKSRGRNLILALAATILFMVLLRRLQRRALETAMRRSRDDALLPRLLNLLFVIFIGIGGVLVFLVVLYFFGDWVLLILVLLLVFGALWASKQAIPHIWTQATLLLNLGPVREGERLNIGGLPWRIAHLNFYTDLVNERLTGGTLRLPISDLTDLRSRTWDEAEPWFPSETGDWVLLSDDTFGQVELQTPDQVVLRMMGGVARTIPTPDYLSLQPTNLSGGFSAKKVFSLDYAHLRQITTDIPARMCEFIRSGLRDTPMAEWVTEVDVFFSDAASSSVDLLVIVTMDGGGASFYKVLPRIIAKLCVDASNEYGWQIPFPQLTVHAAAAPSDRAAPPDQGAPPDLAAPPDEAASPAEPTKRDAGEGGPGA